MNGYQAPQILDLDLSDPNDAREARTSQDEAIRLAIDELWRRLGNPDYIHMPDGRTLTEAMQDEAWAGVCWYVDSTLAEARREAEKRGMRVCDGSHGTPDLRDKFIKGASTNAGSTGGSATCSVEITVTAHAAHTHTYSGTTACCSTCCVVCPATGVDVSPQGHVHTYSGTTDNPSAELTHAACGAVIATEPPYYTMVIVRKM